MYSKEIIVRCESGLYNKQATLFVQKANDYSSSIHLTSEGRRMNAKSLLGVMSLSVVTGSVVTLTAEGPDEKEAVDALEALLQQDIA
ncbi:MAG: HPr family phosphocarrier protein [Ruminococcaceae bacterium]|nr:HPr family phosphocarrier protein [Oscillospiraceae bacterium]